MGGGWVSGAKSPPQAPPRPAPNTHRRRCFSTSKQGETGEATQSKIRKESQRAEQSAEKKNPSGVLTNERGGGGGVPGRDVNTKKQMRGERRKPKSRRKKKNKNKKKDAAEDILQGPCFKQGL